MYGWMYRALKPVTTLRPDGPDPNTSAGLYSAAQLFLFNSTDI